MIEKLTKEQEEKIPIYFEKWRKIGHEYKKIDREKAKVLLKTYLGYAGISTKYVLFFESPMACELAINICKNIFKKPQLSSQLKSHLDSQLYSQLISQLDSQIDSKLYSQIDSKLYSQLDSQLNSQLYSQLKSQIDLKLYSQLISQIYSQLSSQLKSKLNSQLSSKLKSQLSSHPEYLTLGYFYQSGNIVSGYTCFYDFIINEIKKPDKKTLEIWKAFKQINKNLHYFFVFEDFVFCSEKPKELHFKGNNLHNDNGMACKYADGYGIYSLNGVDVPEWLVMTDAERLDPRKFEKIDNAEIRREFVRKVGIERIIQELGAKTIEKNEIYELLNFNYKGRDRIYLKMKNPSIGVYHIEGVHPSCDTIEKALNWRNQTDVKPKVLT